MLFRAHTVLRLLAIGGAAAFVALAAILIIRGSQPVLDVALLIVGGSFLTLVGLMANRRLQDQIEAARAATGRSDLLQEQLEYQRTTIDTLADGLNVAILICEPKANIVYANRRATEIFRLDGPVGRSVLAVTLSYDLEQLVTQAFETQATQERELVFTYPEERVGVARAWADAGGRRVFLAIQDITNLRRLERVRQDFVANVSHELRTPLSVIRAMSETLLDEQPDELSTKYLTKVIDEVDRLSLIANDLLILSVAESNLVRKQACDIAAVVETVCAQLRRKAGDKGLELVYEGPEHLLIEANSTQMSQVVLNLVDNAINYTSSGAIRVQTRIVNPDEVEIAVTDSGSGIASEHLPRIFERFYRVDKGRTRTSGGTGLGLSIVKHIVESHGGRVSVQSELNRGSTFSVLLPVGNVGLSTDQD